MKNTVSRRDFMKGMAVSAAGIAALGASRMPRALADGETLAYIPGTYTSTQSTPYATVDIHCTFSENALTDVTYEVVKTSSSDYFNQLGFLMDNYCKRIVEAGSVDGVDGVASASLSSKAIKDGVNACRIMALGLELPEQQEKTVLNPQDDNFTSFDSDLAEVFSPIQLGGMTLPNRTIKSAGSGWQHGRGERNLCDERRYPQASGHASGCRGRSVPGFSIHSGSRSAGRHDRRRRQCLRRLCRTPDCSDSRQCDGHQ